MTLCIGRQGGRVAAMRGDAAAVLLLLTSLSASAGQYFQDFNASAVGATNFSDGSQLFSTDLGSVAAVTDSTFKELQLTASGSSGTRTAFLLPSLDPGTNVYAFSAKWNTPVYGTFPGAADGYSFSFGPLSGLGLAATNYLQESGYGTGLTVSVNTFGSPGFHVIVNGATVTSFPFNTAVFWGVNNDTRHFFEVDWHVNLGLTLRLNSQVIFSGVPTPGFGVNPSNRFAWAARTGGLTEYIRLDNIVVLTGGHLVQVPMVAPYYKSAEFTNANQTADKAFDGTNLTKWLALASTGHVGATCGGFARSIRAYALMSAEDFPGRDPKAWTLDGSSNAGASWTNCAIGGGSFVTRNEQRAFLATNTASFGAFRLNITTNNGGTEIQLAELKLYEFQAITSAAPFRLVNTPNIPGVGIGANAWADIDNDGDLDIVISGRPGSAPAVGYLFRNQGNGYFSYDAGTFIPGIEVGSLAWGDYNNDGFVDLFVVGDLGTANLIARIYRNNGNGTLSLAVSLPGISFGNGEWMDYNNDGLLDVLYIGQTGGGLWRNNGNDTFTKVDAADVPSAIDSSVSVADFTSDGYMDFLQVDGAQPKLRANLAGSGNFGATLLESFNMSRTASAWGDTDGDGDPDLYYAGLGGPGFFSATGYRMNHAGDLSTPVAVSNYIFGRSGSVVMGDFDTDGDMDILHAGTDSGQLYSRFIRNNGDGSLGGDTNMALDAFSEGNFSPGDFDNDGRLDYLLTGSLDGLNLGITKIWRNEGAARNAPPTAPTGLGSVVTQSLVTLSWSAAHDDTTPTNGLTYNVRISRTPGGMDILSPMAHPTSGLRRIAAAGNAGWNRFKLASLYLPGTYYWSVQAIDNGYAGGPFAAEQSFSIPFLPPEVTTLAPSGISAGNATLRGEVVNFGLTTTVWFAWGTSPALGSNTATTIVGPSPSNVAFSNTVSGLTPGVRHYVRAMASNQVGISTGAIVTFIPLTLGNRFDLTQPGDPISADPDENIYGSPDQAIDNSGTAYFSNNDTNSVALLITPSLTGYPARAFTWVSSSDGPQYDASSVVLSGSIDGTNYVVLSSNNLPQVAEATTLRTFTLTNEIVYAFYRMTFPSQYDDNYLDVSEIELLPYPQITSSNDARALTFLGNGIANRPPELMFDGVLDDSGLSKMEINAMDAPVWLDITPAVGRSILKGFQYVGALDDGTFPGRRPVTIGIMGTDDGTNFTQLVSFASPSVSGTLDMHDYGILDNTLSFLRYRLVLSTPISGTTLQIGEFRLFGQSGFSPIESWRLRHFGTTNNTGNAADDADDDGDGDRNLLEFASGTDPKAAGGSPLFRIALSNGQPRVFYAKDTNAVGTVSWSVEATPSLLNAWSSRSGASETVDSNGPIRTIRFDPTPPVPTNERFRLKVTLP